MNPRKFIFGAFVVMAAAVAAQAEGAVSARITPEDIVQGLQLKGIVAQQAQISLLADVPTRVAHPALEALKLEALSANSTRVLLRCADRTSCIPFYALVNGLAQTEQIAGKPAKYTAQVAESSPVIMKRGAMATLQIVSHDMLITIPVVCLQNGRRGDRIKVSSPDHANTYTAEIVTQGLLRRQL